MKLYPLVTGTVLLLVGILGWVFRSSFGEIPVYHLIADIVLGAWGVYLGYVPDKTEGQ